MTPDQIKRLIKDEYRQLKKRADAGIINESVIYNIISARCRDGARHGGAPENWKLYLPEELRYE